MSKNPMRQINVESPLHKAISDITAVIEKYTDHIDLLDIIDIVDNLRVVAQIAEGNSQNNSIAVA